MTRELLGRLAGREVGRLTGFNFQTFKLFNFLTFFKLAPSVSPFAEPSLAYAPR